MTVIGSLDINMVSTSHGRIAMRHRVLACLVVAISTLLINCGHLYFELDNSKVYINHIAIKDEPFYMNWYGEGIVLPLVSNMEIENKEYPFEYKTDHLYCLGAKLNDDNIKSIKVGTVYKINYHILGRTIGKDQYRYVNFVFIKLINVVEVE